MFNKVLIGVDGGAGGRDALALGRQLAARDAVIVLAYIWDRAAGLASAVTGADHPANIGHGIGQKAQLDGRLDCRLTVHGAASTASGLHAVAAEHGCDLLVIGASAAPDHLHVFSTSGARATIHGAPCAVAVAPSGLRRGIFSAHADRPRTRAPQRNPARRCARRRPRAR